MEERRVYWFGLIIDDGLAGLNGLMLGSGAFCVEPRLTAQVAFQINEVAANMRYGRAAYETELMSAFICMFKAERTENIAEDANILFQVAFIGAVIHIDMIKAHDIVMYIPSYYVYRVKNRN